MTQNYYKAKAQGRLEKPCTGSFRRTMSYPCAHKAEAIIQSGTCHPTDFHPYWYWLDQATQELALSEYRPWRYVDEPPMHPRALSPLEDGRLPQIENGDVGPDLAPTRELHFAAPSSVDPLGDLGILDDLPVGDTMLGYEHP